MMEWKQKPLAEKLKIKALQNNIGVPFEIANLLVQRGIEDFDSAKSFFRPDITDLHNPYLMLGMDSAVERISTAIANQEKIMVYGDYDVDGTTSVALVFSYITSFYPHCSFYIPDRYEEGYGISKKGIKHAKKEGIRLVIALDCGINELVNVAYAKKMGIDFIICDHHLPGAKIPDAVAVLDPKQNNCNYPFKDLCGCGIGFKLIQALTQHRGLPLETTLNYTDLVAMAIAADIVPILGENRILAHHGLKQIRNRPREGIKYFISGLKRKLNISDLVFKIAPRINGAGRIKHGKYAVELLLSKDPTDALSRARAIELLNSERKALDERITQQALDQIAQNKEQENYSSVVFQSDWHKGVIGIVASRLIETYYRPTVVFTSSGDFFTGSVRSVNGVDIYQILNTCKGHIEKFGGHPYAAGLTIKAEEYIGFKKAFEQAVSDIIKPEQRIPTINYDMEISLDRITPKFFRIMNQMGPFGPGNMRPIFMTKNCLDEGKSRAVGDYKSHLRLSVIDDSKSTISGIGFGMANHISRIKSRDPFQLLYTIDENQYGGEASLQLKLKDIRF